MSNFNFNEAPSDSIFYDIKEKAIELWNTYDNTYGYVDEKVNRIKDIQNVRDNASYIVAMFDVLNQRRLYSMVSEESKGWLDKLFGTYSL